jgi:hypothetical protein
MDYLITFLETITKDIKDGTLTTNQLKTVEDFFMEYNLREAIDKDNLKEDETKMIKYLYTGWYIYSLIKNDE